MTLTIKNCQPGRSQPWGPVSLSLVVAAVVVIIIIVVFSGYYYCCYFVIVVVVVVVVVFVVVVLSGQWGPFELAASRKHHCDDPP